VCCLLPSLQFFLLVFEESPPAQSDQQRQMFGCAALGRFSHVFRNQRRLERHTNGFASPERLTSSVLLELIAWFVCRKVIKIPVLLPKQTIHQLDKLKLRRGLPWTVLQPIHNQLLSTRPHYFVKLFFSSSEKIGDVKTSWFCCIWLRFLIHSRS